MTDFTAESRSTETDEDLALIGAAMPAWRLAIARFLFRGEERVDFYQMLAPIWNARFAYRRRCRRSASWK